MKKNFIVTTIFTILVFTFSGCVQNENPLPRNNTQNTWSNHSTEDNIDISDLDGNITESELGMIEETSDTKRKRITFPSSEYNRYAGTGKGTIKGNIFITTPYGNKVLGSGTRLYLNPVTSYSNQWYTESYVGGMKMEKADSRLFNYLKFTAANSEGNFAFYGVPSGSYYLIGTVKCGSECGFDSAKDIRIATRVTVSGSDILQQDLSRQVQ